MQNPALPHAGDACRLGQGGARRTPRLSAAGFPDSACAPAEDAGHASRRLAGRLEKPEARARCWRDPPVIGQRGAFVLKRAAPSCPSGDVHVGDRLRRRFQHSSYATCPFATIPQRRAPPLPGPCRHGHRDRLMAERPWRDGQGGAAAIPGPVSTAAAMPVTPSPREAAKQARVWMRPGIWMPAGATTGGNGRRPG